MAWSKLFKLNMTQDIIRLINLKQIKATHINFTSQHQYVSDNFVSSTLGSSPSSETSEPNLISFATEIRVHFLNLQDNIYGA